jgi:hypothetical protein
LTFVSVVIAWVFFRAGSFPAAMSVLQSMFGIIDPTAHVLPAYPIEAAATVAVLLAVSLLLPNTAEIIGLSRLRLPGEGLKTQLSQQRLAGHLRWRPNIAWGLILGVCMASSVLFTPKLNPFIYFQF